MSVKNGICCSIGDRIIAPCPHSPTGMLADRDRRMDSGSISNNRLAAVDMVADSPIDRVVRFDADDPLSKAARDATKRMLLQTVRTDEEREKRLAQFDRRMAQREWLAQFHARLVAQQHAERPRPDLEAAAAAAEKRINNAWRPRS